MPRRLKTFEGQKETLPIKDKRQLQQLLYHLLNKVERANTNVKKYQADRNYMLVLVGINTAFRAEDLLQLRVIDLNGYISIKENKTGKTQNFKMNAEFKKEVDRYVATWNLAKYDYMFRGQKEIVDGKKYIYPITRQRGHGIVARAGQEIGINYVFGLHSLRKTFGYQYIANGGNVLTLMKMYNHDSTDVTQLYVCWTKDDAEKERTNVFLGVKRKK